MNYSIIEPSSTQKPRACICVKKHSKTLPLHLELAENYVEKHFRSLLIHLSSKKRSIEGKGISIE